MIFPFVQSAAAFLAIYGALPLSFRALGLFSLLLTTIAIIGRFIKGR